jgi:hypothetical protein
MRSRSVFALLFVPLVGCISLDLDLGGKSWSGGSKGLTTCRADATASSRVVHITSGDRIEMLLLIEGSGSGSVSGRNPPSGTIVMPDGRVEKWSCSMRNGQLFGLSIDNIIYPHVGGQMELCGSKYDVPERRVFHIDVRDGQVRVTQLALDPNELASGKGLIRENVGVNAATYPVLAGFFERCEPPE